MLFARKLQVEGGREIVYSTAHASFKGEPQGKDNESVVLHCIIHFESKPYPQAYRCEQGHTLCSMIRGSRHECLFIACHLTSNTPQLTFVCQLMLHELASHLPQVSGIVCSVEVHGVRLATVPGFWQVN